MFTGPVWALARLAISPGLGEADNSPKSVVSL